MHDDAYASNNCCTVLLDITGIPHKNQVHLVLCDSNGTHYTELVPNRNFFHGNTRTFVLESRKADVSSLKNHSRIES